MAEETSKINKGDFVELEFAGKILNTNELFDTNIKTEAEKAKWNIEKSLEPFKPLIVSVGSKMLPQGFDEGLEGKEIGKNHKIELKPEKAFGERNKQLIKMIPIKHFHEQKIQPEPGMQLNLDNQIAKVLSVSGGRVLIDFNNPLSGKNVSYEFKINRKINDLNEKINSLQDFFFKKRFDFSVDEKNNNVILKLDEKSKNLKDFINIISKNLEDILKMKFLTEVLESKPEEKQKQEKNS